MLALTEQSHGNAIGVGLADYTTKRLVEKIDHAVMATNAITAMSPEKGRIPIALETDREAVEAALSTIGAVEPEKARVVHIKNTLQIGELDVSEALLREVEGRKDLVVVDKLGPMSFDGEGNLRPVSLAS